MMVRSAFLNLGPLPSIIQVFNSHKPQPATEIGNSKYLDGARLRKADLGQEDLRLLGTRVDILYGTSEFYMGPVMGRAIWPKPELKESTHFNICK